MSDPDEAPSAEAASSSTNPPPELLSCVSCRSRKLKCDRVKPVCTRCDKVNNQCVYPESRRKPAFKRRNVRELEARLAQVEGLLKDVAKPPPFATAPSGLPGNVNGGEVSTGDPLSVQDGGNMWTGTGLDYDPAIAEALLNGDVPVLNPLQPQQPLFTSTSPEDSSGASGGFSSGELYGLGQFEPLPPHEMIEELHAIYFRKQQQLIPIVHQGRYLQSFYSVPHMRPPMGLQYAIWMMAAHTDEKYGSYHEVFYQRARTYLEHDELKGYGEHFLTVRHAQAWALLSTNEARCMLFTRASMSSARCTKLVMMMGLHRLDDNSEAGERLMAPTLGPPRDWTELEERRRTLWGAFCIDSHASISTGWPNTFDVTEITTRLPSSEEAFASCREEAASTLHDVFKGADYSVFASAVITCHLFNQILRHAHRPQPDERPEDVDYGKFWTRHRSLDNTLSGAFMFLPERFRLPRNLRNPVAVHANLNLHAAVICLHHAACDKADEYDLPDHVRKVSLDRLVTAAGEIVNIMRLTAHMNAGYRSPLVALSLYCACSAYIYASKFSSSSFSPPSTSLSFLLYSMESIARSHIITRSYLAQAVRDIKLNPWMAHDVSKWESLPIIRQANNNVPLLARSSVSRHTKIQPPLPGRLPLGGSGCSGFGVGPGPGAQFAGRVLGEMEEEEDAEDDDGDDERAPGPKRKRTTNTGVVLVVPEEQQRFAAAVTAATSTTVLNPPAASTSPSSSRAGVARQAAPGGLWPPNSAAATPAPQGTTVNNQYPAGPSSGWAGGYAQQQQQLPHRPTGGSPAVSTSSPSATGGSGGGSLGHPTPGVYYAPVVAINAGGEMQQPQMQPPGLRMGEFYQTTTGGGLGGGQWNALGGMGMMQQDGGEYVQQQQQQQQFYPQMGAEAYGVPGEDAGGIWAGRNGAGHVQGWETGAG
ncbi:binuclear zinc transcription factor [Coniochaeta sp. 2T2.1]|nr:binuclear zinc transcription factor [Coniochaeta sp. 2T2.1]